MKVPITDTYVEEFMQSQKILPGGKALQMVREKGLKNFLTLGGVPEPKAEDWRYAPLSVLRQNYLPRAGHDLKKAPTIKGITNWPLAVVYNGRLVSSPKIAGVEILDASNILPAWAAGFVDPGIEANPLEQLNLAFADGGILVRVKNGVKAAGLEVVLIHDGLEDSARYIRNLVALNVGAVLPVFFRIIAKGKSGWLNMVTKIIVEENATLDLAADFETSGDLLVSAINSAKIGSNATLDYRTVAVALSSLRHEMEAALTGHGAVANLVGGMMAAKDETLDFLTRIHHIKGGATSTQTFKGVAGAGGKTAFQGRIVVEEQAQKTDARQTCNNLILNRSGEANVKPELLIFADDVACTHGATVGEIDEAQLFYLMQRGISEVEARNILVNAFLGEIVEGFGKDILCRHFEVKIDNWMKKNGTVHPNE